MSEVKNVVAIQNQHNEPTPMAIINQMVASGTMDVATVQGLLDIQKQFEKSEAVKSFNRDFAKMSAEMPIFKREKKSFTKNYTPLEDIMALARPVLSKYGFSTSFSTKQLDVRSVDVQCTLMHNDGHSIDTNLIIPVEVVTKGMNSMQALGSAVTYGKRYTITMLLNIVTSDMDDNNGYAKSARSGKPQLNDERYQKALGTIKDGKYTVEELVNTYDLTAEQIVGLANAGDSK